MKIYLSASDQIGNITATGHSEKEHCTKISEYTEYYLRMNGYEVKNGDNSQPKTYPNRVKESNEWKADLHICIHTNAGGGEGTVMFCHPNSYNNPYVKAICDEVSKISPGKDRGRVKRTDLYEINKTYCPCAYLEVEFHDRLDLEQWIDANIAEIGKAICNGILKADGKEEYTKPDEKVNYRVQAGAFMSAENAEIFCEKLVGMDIKNYCYYNDGLYHVQVGSFESYENAQNYVKEMEAKGLYTIIV